MINTIDDHELVEAFWKEYIDGFIFHDLKVKANYLVALGAMCYVDYFGKLMRGKRGSERNFKKFVQTYLPQYVSVLDALYREVRCGLVHSYFPENVEVVGVFRDQRTPGPAIWKEKGRWKIAVDDFTQELKIATDCFKSDLLSGRYISKFKSVVLKDPGLSRIPIKYSI